MKRENQRLQSLRSKQWLVAAAMAFALWPLTALGGA